MDSFWKQASKFRDQVAKQQQAVLKQFSGHAATKESDVIVIDEAELQRHQQLERLFSSTRAGKHFQRDIFKGIEGIVSTGSKQLEYATQVGESCHKYGTEGPGATGALGKVAVHYGAARFQIEKEREGLHRLLSTQVSEPLKAMVMGAPLKNSRQLAQRYDRLRQEAGVQSQEVAKRQLKSKEASLDSENVKLQVAEAKMANISSTMVVLGEEAATALLDVDAQQQRLTLQRLIAMVEFERGYHLQVADILGRLYNQMVSERQCNEAPSPIQRSGLPIVDTSTPSSIKSNGDSSFETPMHFVAKVMYPFVAETAVELDLTLGDSVVVRKVLSTGWSEGECKGKVGWFPSSYVERSENS